MELRNNLRISFELYDLSVFTSPCKPGCKRDATLRCQGSGSSGQLFRSCWSSSALHSQAARCIMGNELFMMPEKKHRASFTICIHVYGKKMDLR